MDNSNRLKCQECGKLVGYGTVSAKSFLMSSPALDNIELIAECPECSGKTGFCRKNF
jgi:DNA-directed RNA polymerase subunit RPC12/RpoP